MRYFEDFAEGQVFELGEQQIGEEEILEFARKFDPQPFHVDREKASQSMYGGLIASGCHFAARNGQKIRRPQIEARSGRRRGTWRRRSNGLR